MILESCDCITIPLVRALKDGRAGTRLLCVICPENTVFFELCYKYSSNTDQTIRNPHNVDSQLQLEATRYHTVSIWVVDSKARTLS